MSTITEKKLKEKISPQRLMIDRQMPVEYPSDDVQQAFWHGSGTQKKKERNMDIWAGNMDCKSTFHS